MIPAFRRVLRGAPTGYDLGRATVRAYSESRLRRTLGMLFALLLYVGLATLGTIGQRPFDGPARPIEALAQPISWTNPDTGISTAIPAGWQYEAVPGGDGTTLHGFGNATTGIAAFLTSETFEGDMAAYTATVTGNLGAGATLGAWSMSALPGVWKATGQMLPSGYASTVYTAHNGNQFWRIIYIDERSTTPREIGDPELSAALFRRRRDREVRGGRWTLAPAHHNRSQPPALAGHSGTDTGHVSLFFALRPPLLRPAGSRAIGALTSLLPPAERPSLLSILAADDLPCFTC